MGTTNVRPPQTQASTPPPKKKQINEGDNRTSTMNEDVFPIEN